MKVADPGIRAVSHHLYKASANSTGYCPLIFLLTTLTGAANAHSKVLLRKTIRAYMVMLREAEKYLIIQRQGRSQSNAARPLTLVS